MVSEMAIVDTMTVAILPKSNNLVNIDPDVTILKIVGIEVVTEKIENLGEALIVTTEERMSLVVINLNLMRLFTLISKRKSN